MIEDSIKDLKTFIFKLITVLSDSQVRALNHTFYSDYSDIETAIIEELEKRGMSTSREFEGEIFKY